jgi:hypothetical protein
MGVHGVEGPVHGCRAPGLHGLFEGFAFGVVDGMEQAVEDRIVQRRGDQRVGQDGAAGVPVGVATPSRWNSSGVPRSTRRIDAIM